MVGRINLSAANALMIWGSGSQATSFLVTAWEALAMQKHMNRKDVPVTFDDVQLFQAVQAEIDIPLTLEVILMQDHRFQVIHFYTLGSVPNF